MALADEGLAVMLYEKRALLGGRASSFIDPDSGVRVDNCQHVTMRCCTNLEDFYRRIGTQESIVWWVASEGDNQLHAFDGESGTELFAGDTGMVRRYVTPIAAAGRIIVAGDDAVYAFAY